jgi:nicotinamidase/pyrazinamidase
MIFSSPSPQFGHRSVSMSDSCSAFFENGRRTPIGLTGWLRKHGIRRVVLCALATDFCVAYSAIDAGYQGFEAVVTLDACRGIDLGGSLDAALAQMREAGVVLATSLALPG